MKSFKTMLWMGGLLVLAAGLSAQNPKLVKDINPGTTGSREYWTASMNGLYFFSAYDDINGRELWKSDGTLSGTSMVSDISGRGLGGGYLANCNGTLYFRGNDGITGEEPWKSNGTGAGTVLLKDLITDPNTNIGNSNPLSFTFMNGKTYFSAETALKKYGHQGGTQWYVAIAALNVTDGTAGGTKMISYTKAIGPSAMTVFNNILYFYGSTWPSNSWYDRRGMQTELYKSNGTDKGTVIVKDINPGNEASSYTSCSDYYPVDRMADLNGYLYFRADDGVHGSELWRSDGTASGTTAEGDLYSGSGGATPTWLTAMGDAIYFVGANGSDGDKFWRYDTGTRAISLVKDFNTGADSSFILWLTAVGNKLFLSAKDPASGQELWVSDGTSQGTVLIDINPGTGSSNPNYAFRVPDRPGQSTGTHHGVSNFAVIGSSIYFAADDGVHGVELWRSDGTVTELVKDIESGMGNSNPKYLTAVNGKLFFQATTAGEGAELWMFDPSQPFSKSGHAVAADLPRDFQLMQNHPNPFNPSTGIDFVLPEADVASLRVFDMLGREIAILVNGQQAAGLHRIAWRADGLASGTYLCRLEYRGHSIVRAMHLMK